MANEVEIAVESKTEYTVREKIQLPAGDIAPTSQVLPAANFGSIVRNSTYYGTLWYKGGWERFTGITIPKYSTINSASLDIYTSRWSGLNFTATFEIAGDSRQSPGNPTAGSQVVNPANTTGTVTATTNNPNGFPPAQGDFNVVNVNVQTLVQNLVNNYNYSSGEMVFYVNNRQLDQAWAYLYFRDWGTAKDAQLVIDYTAPWPHDCAGVANANIGKIAGVDKVDIGAVAGVT